MLQRCRAAAQVQRFCRQRSVFLKQQSNPYQFDISDADSLIHGQFLVFGLAFIVRFIMEGKILVYLFSVSHSVSISWSNSVCLYIFLGLVFVSTVKICVWAGCDTSSLLTQSFNCLPFNGEIAAGQAYPNFHLQPDKDLYILESLSASFDISSLKFRLLLFTGQNKNINNIPTFPILCRINGNYMAGRLDLFLGFASMVRNLHYF